MILAIAIPFLGGVGAPELIICCVPLFALSTVAVVIQRSNRGKSGVDASAAPPAWHPDPSARHQLRYWNGTVWTASVSDDGVQSEDQI